MNLFQKKHDWILGGFEFLRADTTIETDPGSGGGLFAVDLIGGANWPYAASAHGVAGSKVATSASNPLPVVQTGTPGLPTGAATAARQDTGNTSLATLAGAVAGTEVQVDVLTAPVTAVTDNGGTLSVDDGGGTLSVDGTVTANAGTGTFAVSAAALPLPSGAATETTLAALNTKTATAKTSDYDTGAGTDTVPMMGLALPASGGAVQGGTATNPVRTDPTGTTAQPVTDNGGALSVDDNGGTLTVDAPVGTPVFVRLSDGSAAITTLPVSLAALPASTNTLEVVGDAAHDAAVAGNPVLVGFEARTNNGAAVANGDAVRAQADINGKQVILPYSIPELSISGATAAMTGTGDTSVIASPGAGLRNYITHILVTNSHATVGTVVEIKSATTVLYRGYAAPVGGGFAIHFPTPLRCAANEALNAANITTGSNTYVSASGFSAP